MNTRGTDAAFAAVNEKGDGYSGLTIREYFAAMCLQGFLSQSHAPAKGEKADWTEMGWGIGEDVWNSLNKDEKATAKTTAAFAVTMADALIEALNK